MTGLQGYVLIQIINAAQHPMGIPLPLALKKNHSTMVRVHLALGREYIVQSTLHRVHCTEYIVQSIRNIKRYSLLLLFAVPLNTYKQTRK